MSRPPGPPPYTATQIAGLSTPTERFIAQAELNSYITGHRIADLRERGLLSYPSYSMTLGASSHGNTDGYGGHSDTSHDGSHDESDVDSHQDAHAVNTSGPLRGNSSRGARGYRPGLGYGGFRPYPRVKPASRHNATSTVESHQDGKSSDASGSRINDQRKQSHGTPIKSTTLCPAFTSTGIYDGPRIQSPSHPRVGSDIGLGKCARLRCADIHDPDKLALCKRFLYKDECTKGDRCRLSHQPTSNNTPHCLYYLEGRCTHSSCPFAHVDVDPAALVCGSFGRAGYCEKGDQCTNFHVYECPEFANEGTCAAGDSCTLRHIHHASRMKARRSSGIGTPQSDQDISDAGETRNDTNSPDDTHAITQQHDYVAFNLDD